MNRALVIAAAFVMVSLIAYGAWLGIVVNRQQTELASIEAKLAQSPVAALSPSPVASQSPSSAPSFAQLRTVTDNFGHTWIYSPVNQTANVLVNSKFVFTATGLDALNRPIEYAYTTGQPPSETVICNWDGPQCSWTGPSTPTTAIVTVYARVKGGPNLTTPCSVMDSCDASLTLQFLFGT